MHPERSLSRASVVIAALLVASCSSSSSETPTPSPTPTPTSPVAVTAAIRAAEGGTVEHPEGARLVIPPGALSRDTTVTIENVGIPAIEPRSPFVPGSRRFMIDLGGAKATLDLELGLDLVTSTLGGKPLDPGSVVVFERAPDGTRHAHSITLGPARQATTSGLATRKVRALEPSGSNFATFELDYVLKPTLPPERPILDVPFYSQDGLGWCVPTSVAMNLHYFQGAPGGETISNWWLAGKNHVTRDAAGGVNPEGLMHDVGFDPPAYVGTYWDIELLDGTPFKNYVESTILGNTIGEPGSTTVHFGPVSISVPTFSGPVPPRPVHASSYVPGGLHGYTIVGGDDEGLLVHDSSGALTGEAGIATPLTWAVYKERIRGPNPDSVNDVWTSVANLTPRPAENRHGSIVMLGGSSSSLTYTPLDSTSAYRWLWGGEPYKFGAYWDAPNCNGGPVDTNWKCAFPLAAATPMLTGTLAYDVYVANVTGTARTYELQVALYEGGHQLEFSSKTFAAVPPRTWTTAASHATGTIPVSQIRKPGLYALTFFLLEDGIGQDLKTTEFPVK